MILSKFLVAIIQIAVLVLAALQAALSNGLTVVESLQIVGIGIGAVVTYVVPLLATGWAAAFKVAGAVLGAVIAAAIPLAAGEWNASTLLIVVLAGLNALATQVGVDVRVQAAIKAIAREGTTVPLQLDTAATRVAVHQAPAGISPAAH